MWSQLNFTLTRGTPGGIKTTSTHQQSTQSFIIIVFPGSDLRSSQQQDINWSNLWWFSDILYFFVFSDRDFVKFLGIATQSLTVTKKSEQTLVGAGPSIEWWVWCQLCVRLTDWLSTKYSELQWSVSSKHLSDNCCQHTELVDSSALRSASWRQNHICSGWCPLHGSQWGGRGAGSAVWLTLPCRSMSWHSNVEIQER